MGWEKFVQCVAEAESLAQPETTDIRAELITKYPTIRCFAAPFLEVFEFRGGGAVKGTRQRDGSPDQPQEDG